MAPEGSKNQGSKQSTVGGLTGFQEQPGLSSNQPYSNVDFGTTKQSKSKSDNNAFGFGTAAAYLFGFQSKRSTSSLLNTDDTNLASSVDNKFGQNNSGTAPRQEQFFDLKSKDLASGNLLGTTNNQKSGRAFFEWGSSGQKRSTKNKVVSITYEEIGLFPRSFSRVFDRFFKQIFSDVENLVIQEYRFYRYLFLTTIKTLCILFFVPLVVNFVAKTYLIRPITEYFWNTQQTEIFLNAYEQKRAFAELHEFEEKLYFESLLISKNAIVSSPFLKFSEQEQFASKPVALSSENSLLNTNGQKSSSGGYGDSYNLFDSPEKVQTTNTDQSILDFKVPNYGSRNNYSVVSSLNSENAERNGASLLVNREAYSTFDSVAVSVGSISEGRDGIKSGLRPEGLIPNNQLTGSVNSLPSLTPQTQRGYPTVSWTGGPLELQEKILELAIRYNNHSIESITNFFADFISLITLLYLLVSLEIQINITKSFLLEVFFGLDDSKKSLLILIMTDLLVGYHSSNLWELFFQFLFNHYGIPESQTGIFLLVATLPVLLDVLFKYLIFRHLNRSSPATVATYHAIIE